MNSNERITLNIEIMGGHKRTRCKTQHRKEDAQPEQQAIIPQPTPVPQVVYQPSNPASPPIGGIICKLADTVHASVRLSNGSTLAKNYIIEDEFAKLQEQYKQLQKQHDELQNGLIKANEQQLIDLRRILESKDAQISQLKNDIEKLNCAITTRSEECEILKQEIEELRVNVRELQHQNAILNAQNEKLLQMMETYERTQIYQKCVESLTDIYRDLQDVLCDHSSPIYAMSGYYKLKILAEKLQEYHYGKFGRFSEIVRDLAKWKSIYESVQSELQAKFNISNMQVFFEIVRIKQYRNCASHPQEKITFEEMTKITQFSKEIWQLVIEHRA